MNIGEKQKREHRPEPIVIPRIKPTEAPQRERERVAAPVKRETERERVLVPAGK